MFSEVFEDQIMQLTVCFKSLFESLAPQVFGIFLFTFVYGLLVRYLRQFRYAFDLLSIVFGYTFLYLFVLGSNVTDFLAFVIASYVALRGLMYIATDSREHVGTSILIATGIYMTYGEFSYHNPTIWLQIRGLVMIVAIKMTSLTHDIYIYNMQKIHVLEFFGYMLSPATVAFGPGISFKQHLTINYEQTPLNINFFKEVNRLLGMTYLAVYISTCTFYENANLHEWTLAFFKALSFRTSHYFICKVSELTMIASGYNSAGPENWGFPVVKPFLIELPRSLQEVVTFWNIPMSLFLREHFYNPLLRKGRLFAIISTFTISSMYHGFNVEVTLILMHLGLFSYIQNKFRNKLAEEFDACIKTKRCVNCDHTYKTDNFYVVLANAVFVFMAMMDLTYLGVLMDDVGTHTTFNQSIIRVFGKWKRLYFVSHLLNILMYFLRFTIDNMIILV